MNGSPLTLTAAPDAMAEVGRYVLETLRLSRGAATTDRATATLIWEERIRREVKQLESQADAGNPVQPVAAAA